MSTRTASRLLLAALAAGSLLLAGCEPATGQQGGTSLSGGCDPHGFGPFSGCGTTTGQTGETAEPVPGTCDPHGFGPLSRCADEDAGEQARPMGKDDWPGVAALDGMLGDVSPGGDAGWVVTKKYHADSQSCVEFRAPGAPDDPFRRLCVPDGFATNQDRDWLDHQVVGQPKWTGGAS